MNFCKVVSSKCWRCFCFCVSFLKHRQIRVDESQVFWSGRSYDVISWEDFCWSLMLEWYLNREHDVFLLLVAHWKRWFFGCSWESRTVALDLPRFFFALAHSWFHKEQEQNILKYWRSIPLEEVHASLQCYFFPTCLTLSSKTTVLN